MSSPRPPATPASWAVVWGLLLGVVVAAGCGRATKLMETPNLYRVEGMDSFGTVDPAKRTTAFNVYYVTDREPIRDERTGALVGYSRHRSPYLRVGTAEVTIGRDLSWDELVAFSTSDKRGKDARLRVGTVTELVRFPGSPYNTHALPDRSATYEEYEARLGVAAARADMILYTALEDQPQYRDVYVYIHGYNNTFEDAVFVMAGFWHFMGRHGLPVVFTWPAGAPGLTGYTTDSESGDFSVYHLKQLLGALAASNSVERIHLLAHSRGTDVTISALREMVIAERAAGRDPRQSLKIENLVLASADIDSGVFSQRFVAERVMDGVGHLTIFASPEDAALKLSRWLHSSTSRLGLFLAKPLSEANRLDLEQARNVTVIDARVKTNFIGHNYFYSNPAVSSDLILLLRDRLPAGARHGRPLTPLAPNLWAVEDGYPLKQPTLVEYLQDTILGTETPPEMRTNQE